MKKLLLSVIFFLLSFGIATRGHAYPYVHEITWTNPSTNAVQIDTTYFNCEGGDSLTDLHHAEIWGLSHYFGDGLPHMMAYIDEWGKEGLPDSTSLTFYAPTHIYIFFVDFSGMKSCASNVICIECTPVTGVNPEPTDVIYRIRYFDLRGRLVSPRAAGIYFKKTYYRSGRTTVTKEVILK